MSYSVMRAICFHPEDGYSEAPEREGINACIGEGNIFWLDLSDADMAVSTLREAFKVHNLIAVEFAETNDGVSKARVFDDSIFLKWLVPPAGGFKELSDGSKPQGSQLKVCIGERFIVTLHDRPIEQIDDVFELAGHDKDQFRYGPATVLYAILDGLVDQYFRLADTMTNEVDALEDFVFENPAPDTRKRIFEQKKSILDLRLCVSPQREAVNAMLRHETPLIPQGLEVYFQDLYDHLVRVTDHLDIQRDIIAGSMDIYLSSISNRLNEIMKVLTIVSTVILPLTLISGIYGMNFRHMPELYWTWGYGFALVLMLVIAVSMLLWLKRRKWL